jgi:bleomycin hydrolase
LGFYKKYINMDIDEYVSIVDAPTIDNPFNRTYTVKFLGNVKDGDSIKYINVDMESLRDLAITQLKEDEPVWFGCDVGKFMDGSTGILDVDQYIIILS